MLEQKVVEPMIELDEFRGLLGCECIHLIAQEPCLLDVLLDHGTHGATNLQGDNEGPHVVNLVERLGRHVDDAGAAVGRRLDEPILSESPDRLADRRHRRAHALCPISLEDGLFSMEGAAQDLGLHGVIDIGGLLLGDAPV